MQAHGCICKYQTTQLITFVYDTASHWLCEGYALHFLNTIREDANIKGKISNKQTTKPSAHFHKFAHNTTFNYDGLFGKKNKTQNLEL